MEAPNVLLVDDQPAKLLTYEAMLAGIGANLIKAATAREALALLLRTEIALVLMDVNMPELDGFELAAMIRQHPRCQRTAIIFVSAIHLSDVDRLRGYETGAVDYVSVPVVPEILRAKVGVFLDLYRKSTELEQLNATLEERVSARTAELERSVAQLRDSEHHLRLQREALEEANRRKNQFLAMLAHELRNPLQPILTAMELGRQPEIAPTEMEWSRNVIERQFKLLVRLVDDLLDASRINSGKLALRRENIALAEVVAAAVDSVRPSAEAKRQTLDVDVPREPVEILADGARLTQVFFNLLGNAVKFTPHGGRIALTVARDANDIEIRVCDNGTGIPGTQLPRIFEMFFQGEGRPGTGPGGLGLGLALVKQLVELHGGCVSARSAGPGTGSEFCVRLPARVGGSDATIAKTAQHAELPRGPARRIVVVDDNRDAAESLALMLRLLGNEVEVVFDGAAAEAAVVRFQPDVVLMDLGMPKLDGYQTARAIRGLPHDKRVMLIAITGWGGETDRRMSSEAGFDRHLVKPVQPSELLAVLSSLDQVSST
jgi:signal transduction histidine kinase